MEKESARRTIKQYGAILYLDDQSFDLNEKHKQYFPTSHYH